jgi:hypothetical protein
MADTAANLDEFNEQARSFVTKAKAGGASNTAIMNTIRMKYDGFKTEQARQITPYQQAMLDRQTERDRRQDAKEDQDQWIMADVNGDGVMEWVNKRTQEVKETGYGTDGDDWASLDQTGDVTGEAGVEGNGLSPSSTDDEFARAEMLKQAEEQAVSDAWASLPEDERFLQEGKADVAGRMWHQGNQQPMPEQEKEEFAGVLPSVWKGIKGIPGTLGKIGSGFARAKQESNIASKASLFGKQSLSDEERKILEGLEGSENGTV